MDITLYEAARQIGGGFFLGGSAATGYNLPGSVFDKEFRCTFDLLQTIPSTSDPAISVKDEFFAFNAQHPICDLAHLLDRDLRVRHRPHFGLGVRDALDLLRISLMPEAWLDGRRIDEFFSQPFFSTEFWFLWSTIMGSLPQHSATEFRRYMHRFLAVFPYMSDMAHILRTRLNQHQAFIEPLAAWLRQRGVTLMTGAFVRDISFAPSAGRITIDRLDYEQNGVVTSVAVAPDDIVLVTLGSQVEDMSVGSMSAPPPPQQNGRSSSLWKRIAQGRSGFGDPDVYFGRHQVPLSRWVTFTVTTTGTEFIEQMSVLTGSEPGSGGLVTLQDSGWLLSLTIFHQPEVIGQPPGTYVWWGYGLYPESNGDFVQKRMYECTGMEILEEVLRQLRFDRLDRIMTSSICIPCDMPYVNNVWLPRRRIDRPPVIPEGATNLGLLGQYAEVPRDVAFTIEYSARTAWEAVHLLLKRGPAPPPVYQGQNDPKALLAALKVFLF